MKVILLKPLRHRGKHEPAGAEIDALPSVAQWLIAQKVAKPAPQPLASASKANTPKEKKS